MIQRAVTSVIGVALGIFVTFGVPSRYLAAVVLLVIVGAVYYWLKLRPQQGGVQDNEGMAGEDDFADWYAQPMMTRRTRWNHPQTVPRIMPDPILINRTVRH